MAVHPCPKCDSKFQYPYLLARHLRTHDNVVLCDRCGRTFQGLSNFQNHHCRTERGYHCSDCDTYFQNFKSKKNHSHISCTECERQFSSEHKMNQHRRDAHPKFTCAHCDFSTFDKSSLERHMARKLTRRCPTCLQNFHSLKEYTAHVRTHTNTERATVFLCPYCKVQFQHRTHCKQHETYCKERLRLLDEQSGAGEEAEDRDWVSEFALNKEAALFTLYTPEEHDLNAALLKNRHKIEAKLNREREQRKGIKYMITVSVGMVQENAEAQELVDKIINSENHSSFHESDIREGVSEAILECIQFLDHLEMQGSSWVQRDVFYVQLCVATLLPLEGSSYIPTPKHLRNSKFGLINIKNKDNMCFKWAMMCSVIQPRIHPERMYHYINHPEIFNFHKIVFPFKIEDIPRFEKQNPGYSVSVYTLINKKVHPLRVPKHKEAHHVNLLLLTKGDKKHYVWFRKLDPLLYDITKHKTVKKFCCYCLNWFYSKQARDEHESRCKDFGAQRTVYAKKGSRIEYKSFDKEVFIDTAIYVDFETLSQARPDDPRRTHECVPISYAMIAVDPNRNLLFDPIVHSAKEGAHIHFVTQVLKWEHEINENRKDYPIHMSQQDEINFQKATHCYLCKRGFKSDGSDKARDHDHEQEENNYKGASHIKCNVNRRRKRITTVWAHNMSRYDSHLIFQALCHHPDIGAQKISVIPKTMERYISFTVHLDINRQIRFLDTFNFINKKLAVMASLLEDSDYKIMPLIYPDPEQFNLLKKGKGFFPHEYCEKYEDYEACVALPAREHFHSSLGAGSDITEEDHLYAQNVWDAFHCSNLLDYLLLYNLCDVLILAEVFSSFRDSVKESFGLDACHFYTLPGLGYAACLKMTGMSLEGISDPDMFQFFEMSLRGGVSTVAHRWAEANHEGLGEHYDPSKPKSFIFTTDCVSLYAHCLMQALPIGGFEWVKVHVQDPSREMDWTRGGIPHPSTLQEEGEFGYAYEVDLITPPELHAREDPYPLAPTHMIVPQEMMSPTQRQLREEMGLPLQDKTKKLVCHVGEKKKYVCHGLALKYYLSMGLQVTRVYRVLKFRQGAIIRPYIDFNIQKRKEAKTELEKELYKLFCNSVYGKLLENNRKHINVKIVTEPKKFRKLVRSPLFHRFVKFSENMVAVQMKPATLKLDNPVYAGFSVLDISKVHMMKHYHRFRNAFPDKSVTFCGGDTDALHFHVKTEDLYRDLAALKEMLDTSNFPKDHPMYSEKNKKKPGTFTIEHAGRWIRRYIALRSKNYIMEFCDCECHKRCKGVKKDVLHRHVTYEDYFKCLIHKLEKRVNFVDFKTDGKHHIFREKMSKSCLRNDDPKRYLLPDLVTSKAYFSTIDDPVDRPRPPPSAYEQGDDHDDDMVAHRTGLITEDVEMRENPVPPAEVSATPLQDRLAAHSEAHSNDVNDIEMMDDTPFLHLIANAQNAAW